jgi:hypothetical protein
VLLLLLTLLYYHFILSFSRFSSSFLSFSRTNVVLSPDVEEYMQHVLDYVVRDTLEDLSELCKHRQESTKTASNSSLPTTITGYDLNKYDAIWGPLPTHKIHIVKANKKRKDMHHTTTTTTNDRNNSNSNSNRSSSSSSSSNNNNNNSNVTSELENNKESKLLLHALKQQVINDKDTSDSISNEDENSVATIDESMIRLIKEQLISSRQKIPTVPYEETRYYSNNINKSAVTSEDMKTLIGRASHKSIYSANFIASLFQSGEKGEERDNA